MTGKRCTDCRHTKGIGYDFWCGEGHAEYEVFGAETNCPYFEYHDWSKGVPNRTVERFTLEEFGLNFIVNDNGRNLTAKQTVDILNELNDKCEFLEIENESLEDGATKYAELYHKSLKENKQLQKSLSASVEKNRKLQRILDKLGYEYIGDLK